MARVAVDWTKMAGTIGALDAPGLMGELDPSILALCTPEAEGKEAPIKTRIGAVTLNVGEAPNVKQYGAKFLRIDSASDSALDSILAVIKTFGAPAVCEAYSETVRNAKLAKLEQEFGGVEKAIAEGVAVLVKATGMNLADARAFVIAKRTENNLRTE